MKVQNKGQKNKGFTLIELVVVVAIIGVLAAIVTPRIRTSLMRAKDSKAVATLDALRTATNVYYAEKGKIPFDLDDTDGITPPTADSNTTLDVGHLALLVKYGYLDKQSALRLTSETLLTDELLTTPTISGNDVPNMAVGVVQENVATNCADDDGDGILDPQSTAANTTGYVRFVWADDGVGVNIVPVEADGATDATGFLNTNCELWESK